MNKMIIAAALTLAAFTTQAQDIKGVSIGMTVDEVTALFPTGTSPKDGFVVGGIRSKYNAPAVEYKDGKVSSVTYFFDPSDFDTMLTAFKAKYPDMVCEDSTVQNGMGAKFKDTGCKYKNLALNRLISMNSSAVSLQDVEDNARKRAERAKKAAGTI